MKFSLLAALSGAAVLVLVPVRVPALAAPTPAQAPQLSSIDRRLLVAVTSYTFDERAALDALAAGADINGRNAAMDNDTVLIAAIRQFRDTPVIQWLLDHRANPALANNLGRNAASYFRQYHMDKTASGRAVLARLEGAAASTATPPALTAASPNQQIERSAPAPTPSAARPHTNLSTKPLTGSAPTAGYGPPIPGVYECMNQQAMISPMGFGLIDASTFTTSGGRRGRYTYGDGILTLDSGANAARYQRTGPNLFRPLLPNGQLGGFTCPLNRAKSPTRLPW